MENQEQIPNSNPQTLPPAPPSLNVQAPQASLEYVGFGKRFLAYFVDGLILFLVSGAIGFSFAFGKLNIGWTPGLLIGVLYYVFFWVKQDGQTLGNKLLAIKVVREDGRPLDIGTGVIRYIGYIVSIIIFYLGFLWVIWDKKKQGWHDKMAGTVVVPTGGKSHTGIATAIVVGFFVLIFIIFIAFGAMILYFIKVAQNNPKAFQNTFQQQSKTSIDVNSY